MNRIEKKFKELKKRREAAFIAFLTAGDPSLKVTAVLAREFEKRGVDIIELGVPFSDPLADGPTIQAASNRALKRKVNLKAVLKLVRDLRRETSIPLALLTYYNPLYHYGLGKFTREASRTGLDGVIIPDLPPEEARELKTCAREVNLATIFLVSPTTTAERMKRISRDSTGFIYCVALTGITGARDKLAGEVSSTLRKLRRITRKPVAVGFGISKADQVRKVASFADGVIVGSALVRKIEENLGRKSLVKQVGNFVESLVRAAKQRPEQAG